MSARLMVHEPSLLSSKAPWSKPDRSAIYIKAPWERLALSGISQRVSLSILQVIPVTIGPPLRHGFVAEYEQDLYVGRLNHPAGATVEASSDGVAGSNSGEPHDGSPCGA